MEALLKSRLKDGRFVVSAERSKNMAAIRGRGNKTTEVRLKMGLVRAGIRDWTTQRSDLPGKPDFFFELANLAVFVDGCFWHGCARCGHIPKTNADFWRAKIERNRKRHRKVAAKLNRHGMGTMRFWEHQLRDNLDGCLARIVKRLS